MSIGNKKQTFENIDLVFVDRQNNTNFVTQEEQNSKKRGYKELVLNLFEKSPEIGRLLVRLHDRNKLYMIARSPDESACAKLTQTVVDLLSFHLTPAEDELISDVLMSLINQAERNLRRALSERLAVMEDIPLRLILKMASDEIFVADPVLRKSEILKDFDLIYLIKSHGPDHWRAIATRPNIPEKISDILVDVNDFETSVNLAENKQIHLGNYAINRLFEKAKTSDKLAKPLLMRDEISPKLISKLFQFVGQELKSYIRDNFPEIDCVDSIIDSIISEFGSSSKGEVKTTSSILSHAELMMETGSLTPSVMLDHLKRGQVSSFVAQFSVYCGLPTEKVKEMIHQKTAQTLAVVCKAMMISKSDFLNIFLLTSRVRGARLIEEHELSRAIAYYDRVTEAVAIDLLKRYRH